MQHLAEIARDMSIRFVTTDLYAKCYGNHTGHEHRFCKLSCVREIHEKSAETSIAFVTSDLYAQGYVTYST